jgi:hypothetical protein
MWVRCWLLHAGGQPAGKRALRFVDVEAACYRRRRQFVGDIRLVQPRATIRPMR